MRSFGKESAQNLFAAGWKTGKPQEEPVSRNQKPSLGLGFADPGSQAFQKPQDERRGIDMAPRDSATGLKGAIVALLVGLDLSRQGKRQSRIFGKDIFDKRPANSPVAITERMNGFKP